MKHIVAALAVLIGALLLNKAFPTPAEVYTDELHDVETRCLTQAIYFESATEPEQSQRAVAEVVLNRRDSGRYPRFVCDVITDAGQFTWFHGWPMKPGSMDRWWQLYEIARDEMGKRPVVGDSSRQIIPNGYLYFCSGDTCLKRCSGTVIGKQCYYGSSGTLLRGSRHER